MNSALAILIVMFSSIWCFLWWYVVVHVSIRNVPDSPPVFLLSYCLFVFLFIFQLFCFFAPLLALLARIVCLLPSFYCHQSSSCFLPHFLRVFLTYKSPEPIFAWGFFSHHVHHRYLPSFQREICHLYPLLGISFSLFSLQYFFPCPFFSCASFSLLSIFFFSFLYILFFVSPLSHLHQLSTASVFPFGIFRNKTSGVSNFFNQL